jgi:hypothetical protein
VAVNGMAQQVGVSLYSLPPYHCEVNLFELVWTEMKKRVAVNNTQFGASFVDNLIQGVPLATEPGFSLIILTPMKILQRNLNRSRFVV